MNSETPASATTPAGTSTDRTVERVVAGQPTSDGAGVKLLRLLTHELQYRLDPYLMLDLFGSDQADDYIRGFPDHPHRGFETITMMIEGRMRHRDSAGHEGLLTNGSVQWMVAGRGLIHSELPEQESGRMAGFQLWLNLPARDKLCDPWYRDIDQTTIPTWTDGGIVARVVAGHSHGVDGAMQRPTTEPGIVDLSLPAGAAFTQAMPATHNAFVAVQAGAVTIGGTRVAAGQLAILRNDAAADQVTVNGTTDGPSRLLVVNGQPLRESIAQYGPFVMNTDAQVFQAVEDFRAGRMG